MTKAAIYLRISLDTTGEHLGVTRQREDCEKIAQQRGWDVVEVYEDNSISASKANVTRPAYERMLKDYEAGRFEAVVCWDLDRLTRQPRQLEDWIDKAQNSGLKLVTANGEADLTTDGGQMFARIKAAVARSEVDRKSARHRRAAQQAAEMGRFPKAIKTYGYTRDGQIIEHEAEIVREIFQRFVRGESKMSIQRDLDARGVPTPRETTRGWVDTKLTKLLGNPTYIAVRTYKGEEVAQGDWEPIISEGVFRSAQGLLSASTRRKGGAGKVGLTHIGSGFYLCGVCGRKVYTLGSKGRGGYRYGCMNSCLTRKGSVIDEYVLGATRLRLSQPDVRELMQTPETKASLQPLEDEAMKIEARLKRFETDYEAGEIDGRMYRKLADKAAVELAEVYKVMERRLQSTGIANVLTAKDPVAAFDEAPIRMQRQIISTLMTVTLLRGRPGRRQFDPDSVILDFEKHAV